MKDIEILLIIGGIFFIIGLYMLMYNYKEEDEAGKENSKTALGIALGGGILVSVIGYFISDEPNLKFHLLLSVSGLIIAPVTFGGAMVFFAIVALIKWVFNFLLKSGAYIVVYTFRGLHKLKEESERYIEKNK